MVCSFIVLQSDGRLCYKIVCIKVYSLVSESVKLFKFQLPKTAFAQISIID